MTDLAPSNLRSAPKRKPRRILRAGLVVLLILATGALITGLRLYQLYHRVPQSWVGYQQWKRHTPRQQQLTLADALVQRVTELANIRDRNGAPIGTGNGLGQRTIHMSFAEVNAWLDTQLPSFLLDPASARWTHGMAIPPGLTEPMVADDPDGSGLILSCHYQQGSFNAIISTYCDLTVPREGVLNVAVRKVKLNDLGVPRGILSRALSAAPAIPSAVSAGQLLDGKSIDATAPVWGGTRQARLTAVAIGPDGMDVTVDLVRHQDPGTLTMANPQRIVVGITGASGALYARRAIRLLLGAGVETHLVVSPLGQRLLHDELGMEGIDLPALAGRAAAGAPGTVPALILHNYRDVGAPIASGSFAHNGMVIIPCSSNTLSAVATGSAQNLLHRAAQVCLKERRRLILVHREMPISLVEIRNMGLATRAGAIICPASPGFYMLPRTVEDLVDFVVARVLDLLGVEHHLNVRWSNAPGETVKPPGDSNEHR